MIGSFTNRHHVDFAARRGFVCASTSMVHWAAFACRLSADNSYAFVHLKELGLGSETIMLRLVTYDNACREHSITRYYMRSNFYSVFTDELIEGFWSWINNECLRLRAQCLEAQDSLNSLDHKECPQVAKGIEPICPATQFLYNLPHVGVNARAWKSHTDAAPLLIRKELEDEHTVPTTTEPR